MKRALWLLARLYPVAWRKRYGMEFDALLEDVPHNLRTLLDVFEGAFKMQLKSWSGVRLVAALGVAGIIVAACVSLVLPRQYQSTALIDIAGPTNRLAAGDLVNQLLTSVLSRRSLSELINREDLYRSERTRMPMEEVIERLRRDIKIVAMGQASSPAFQITVTSDSPQHAQIVNQTLISSLMEQHARSGSSATLKLVDPVNKSKSPVSLRYGLIATWGLAGGLVVGLMVALVRHQPRLAGTAATFGVAGALLAFAASWMMTEKYVSTAVLRLNGASATGDVRDIANNLAQTALSRDSLAQIIQKSGLYQRERASMPLDKVVEEMRARDIRISNLAGASVLSVAVVARDSAFAAQSATQDLVARMIDESRRRQSEVALETLDPASFPHMPVSPNRATITVLGLVAGLLLGVTASILRRPIISGH
jgi:capsular polysaccharide biosynthesis protein